MKADDLDVVRLLRPLPDHGLLVGAEGTVVFAASEYSSSTSYLAELSDFEGVTQAVATVRESDLEVTWRLGVGWLPSFEPDAQP